MPQLVGQVLQDTYLIEQLLGRGGMGEVYLASHRRLPRRFAIKVLYPALGCREAEVARFRREAEVISSLAHPHIVEVIDFNFIQDGPPYIVMEYLEGEDLGTRLQRIHRLDVPQAAAILRQAASGIHAAHRRGIIHRDIKPRNIFLCRKEDRDDYVKVVDFGLSKVIGSQTVVTNAQMAIGTPRHMAPEQALGRSANVDARTDVFAMGTVLYRTLAGQLPFPGATVQVVLHNVVYVDPPPLDTLDLGVPAAVSSVVAVALRKRPEERYASMEALAHAFLEAARDARSEAVAPSVALLDTDPGAPPASVEQLSLSPLWKGRPQDADGTEILPVEPSAAASAASDDLPIGVYPAVEPAPASAPYPEAGRAARPPDSSREPGVRRRRVGARVIALAVAGLVVLVISAAGVWLGLHMSAERWGRTSLARDVGATPRNVTAPLDSPSAGELRHRVVSAAPDAGPVRDAVARGGHRVRLKKKRVAVSPPRLSVITQIDKQLAWSNLYVDGKMRGQTALKLTLAPGAHTVEVRRPGYQPQSTSIVLRPGQEKTLRLELKKVTRGQPSRGEPAP